jgi:hypothetical protein
MSAAGPTPGVASQDRSYDLHQAVAGHYSITVDLGEPVRFRGYLEPVDRVPFIFDTATTHTAVAEPVAAQLGYQRDASRYRRADSMTGAFDTEYFTLSGFDFGAGSRAVNAIVLFDDQTRAFHAAGLVGADAIGAGGYSLDLPAAQLRLTEGGPLRGDLRLSPERLMLGEARVGGVSTPIKIMIDTGATASLGNMALARAARGGRSAQTTQVEGVSSSETVVSYERKLVAGLEVGDLCMGWFYVSVADVHAFDVRGWADEPALIIGLDVLRHARIDVDRETGLVDISGLTDHECER